MKSLQICHISGCNLKARRKIKKDGTLYYYKHCEKHRPFSDYRKHCRLSGWKKQGINITLDIYDNMFEEQKGCCAICGIHQSKLKKALAPDHSHISGKIRKLTCVACNLLIGKVENNKAKVLKCMAYLEGFRD